MAPVIFARIWWGSKSTGKENWYSFVCCTHVGIGDGGIRLYRIERHASRFVVAPRPIHFWNVIVAQRAIRRRKEYDDRLLSVPFFWRVNHVARVAQCELRPLGGKRRRRTKSRQPAKLEALCFYFSWFSAPRTIDAQNAPTWWTRWGWNRNRTWVWPPALHPRSCLAAPTPPPYREWRGSYRDARSMPLDRPLVRDRG